MRTIINILRGFYSGDEQVVRTAQRKEAASSPLSFSGIDVT